MLELLALHLVVLNPQVFMILWKLLKKWHHQRWKNNWTIQGSRKLQRRGQKSIRMVENTWGIILVCWVCGSTNSKDCWFTDEAERVFSVASICTNLRCFWLGIKNLEMLISIYKNWPDDAHVEDLASMKRFMDMDKALMEENEGLIDQVGHLDIKENGNRL